MENSLEDHAVLNLLHLCDEESIVFNQMHSNPQYNILTEKEPSNKTNTINRLTHTLKVKTENSPEYFTSSTQNKENLKKILEKLRDSPVHAKKKTAKKKEIENKHVKTEPQSRLKLFKKTPERIERASYQRKESLQKDKQKEIINALVKAKIIQKLKMMEQQKSNRQYRQQSFRISTVRDIQGLKRGQASLEINRKDEISIHGKHEINSRLTLLKADRSIKNTLLSGKCSHVNLKHLLF